MHTEQFKKLIEKQLQGTLTKEEEKVFHEFENKLLKQNENKVFEDDQHRNRIKSDIKSSIARRKKRVLTFKILKAAASIAILFSLASLYFLNNTHNEQQIEIAQNDVKETQYGQKFTLTLSDGTIVKLNSDSRIIYPKKFSGSTREIELEGEAFFDVAHNPDKPFIIKTGDLSTKVLGTSFNIQAYKESKNIEVTLATGKVALYNKNKLTSNLTPSEQASFSKTSGELNIKKVDISKYIEWKEGVLRFENTSLAEASIKLEKWFGVQFKFENDQIKNCHFTGVFKNESLQNILDNISFIKPNITYKFNNDKNVTINGNCTN
ncbi:FecR family protein [Tenacibaculum xiamenense]|uniref:FecR family protein n=1 Tax=Tenacibaculum xiamenense TaxID=1261553 RepID=UPI0038B5B304